MQNPFSDQELPEHAAEVIRDLRTVRRNSRRATRSGHPGKRAEAQRITASVPYMISRIYAQNA